MAAHQAPVPGILQARTLEWVAISFSSAAKWKVKVKSLSHVRLLATPWTAAHQALPSMGFSRQECWSGVPLPSLILSDLVIFFLGNSPHSCFWHTCQLTHVQGYSMQHFCKSERPESTQTSFSVALIKETIAHTCSGTLCSTKEKKRTGWGNHLLLRNRKDKVEKQHREHCVCFTNVAYVEKGRGGGAPSICLYKHNAIWKDT